MLVSIASEYILFGGLVSKKKNQILIDNRQSKLFCYILALPCAPKKHRSPRKNICIYFFSKE